VTPDFRLHGAPALVTGGRRGLGRAIAAALVGCGARVAISHEGAHDAEETEATAKAIGAVAMLPGDLRRPDAPAALIAEAAKALGGLRILVCNAAAERRESLTEITAEGMDLLWAVNVRATLGLVRAAIPLLENGGRVVLLGSVQAMRPNPHQLAYAATKAALTNMGRNLAKQLAPRGIAVNILSPGAIATEGNAQALADPAYRTAAEARIPAARIGVPDDVAGAAVFLCSPAAAYVTGAELVVDGGLAVA
jgi:NAD(P)-dependent dehydrogenase (short-subunit alcohol dehydrogenase family)